MTKGEADASPEKGLFLEMFTRDLSLEDCILDLVDNSIDSLIRSRSIDVSKALVPFSTNETHAEPTETEIPLASIDVICNQNDFQIIDNCGGISVKNASTEVFRFGHSPEAVMGQLGVYGIGLKRAIFKIGNSITIKSQTANEGFLMEINVPSWSKNTSWKLPFEVINGTGDSNAAGTSITITSFREEIAERFKSETFVSHLKEMIERTYCLFLNRHVKVTLNGQIMQPKLLEFGSSDDVNVAKEVIEFDGVKATLYAGLAPRDKEGQWRAADAGWYVACNGRLVVTADKSDVTGWGSGLPIFVPKYRGFIGLAFFSSINPLLLPWKTTKQGLHQESMIFQRTRTKMAVIARPVLTFLDSMYNPTEEVNETQRQLAEEIKTLDVRELTSKPATAFKVVHKPPGETLVSVQYGVRQNELSRIKKSLGKGSWPASRIGRYTFEYYLKAECPE